MPSLEIEQMLHDRGHTLVAGVDEVGRGPLAGPVMAGAVILPPDLHTSVPWLQGVNDSKKLTPLQRERAAEEIHLRALGVGIGLASSGEIDASGIVAATKLAMLRAIEALPWRPQHLLIDFLPLEESGLPFSAVIGGDSRCYSIAAASIAAKVARDRMMVEASDLYPGYDFHLHKGYGTQRHLNNLKRLGPCPIHRLSFAPVRLAQEIHRKAQKCPQTEVV